MKYISSAFVGMLLATSSAYATSSFDTGVSFDFTSANFAASQTASTEYVINTSGSTEDTQVWDQENMAIGDDGRLAPGDASVLVPFSVTYKVTTPAADLIRSFTLGIDDLVPDGSASATLTLDYSTDGSNWTNFYTTADNGAELSDTTFTESLATPSDELFVRVETNGVSDASAYYALWSNRDFADDSLSGGANPEAFISVTVPEPSTYALMLSGVAGLVFLGLRKSKLSLS